MSQQEKVSETLQEKQNTLSELIKHAFDSDHQCSVFDELKQIKEAYKECQDIISRESGAVVSFHSLAPATKDVPTSQSENDNLAPGQGNK